MHPQLLEKADVLEKGLETPCLMRFACELGRTTQELLGNGAISIVLHVAIAKEPPSHCDHIGVGDCIKQRVQRSIPGFDVDVFIHINTGDPFGGFDHRLLLGGLQGSVLRGHVHCAKWVLAMLNIPFAFQQLQHAVRAIRAVICIYQNIVKSD